ncbi:GDP-mannose pyrophosphatase NudK [Neolewinella agarilytica]|uniref:GDP-mannose pyrophosphatase NudK n=1 Tax=Neolewinella agarilytica TaxID=478744 RepID=UPI0023526C9D|nr:GDP-mannose pyrophosphatase NudK [Neolewinella agarilytica]
MPNSNIRNLSPTLLSDNWYTLKKYRFEYRNRHGQWIAQEREAYDRGNGAAILLYHPTKKTVILTRQFRLPAYVNGNEDGMLIEACAGLLEEDDPLECIKKESIEETGYHVENVQKVFEAYMSPGSVTEILHFFVAEYDESLKQSSGGGLAEEQEEIEILELDFSQALAMIKTGEIKDAKTIMLLYHLALEGVL